MPDASPQLALNVTLDDEARFETFHTGRNAAAVSALRACEPPGLWLAGAAASGRTHLLQALVASRPRGQALYLPLAADLPPEAVDGLDPTLTVCLDDIDSVAGVPAWERALFLLSEQALMQGGRLIVSASGQPGEAGFGLRDLESRLSALPVYRLRTMNDEERIGALQQRAAARGLTLPEEAARYMLTRLPRDFPTLLNALTHLDRESLAASRRLTVPFVSAALRRLEGG